MNQLWQTTRFLSLTFFLVVAAPVSAQEVGESSGTTLDPPPFGQMIFDRIQHEANKPLWQQYYRLRRGFSQMNELSYSTEQARLQCLSPDFYVLSHQKGLLPLAEKVITLQAEIEQTQDPEEVLVLKAEQKSDAAILLTFLSAADGIDFFKTLGAGAHIEFVAGSEPQADEADEPGTFTAEMRFLYGGAINPETKEPVPNIQFTLRWNLERVLSKYPTPEELVVWTRFMLIHEVLHAALQINVTEVLWERRHPPVAEEPEFYGPPAPGEQEREDEAVARESFQDMVKDPHIIDMAKELVAQIDVDLAALDALAEKASFHKLDEKTLIDPDVRDTALEAITLHKSAGYESLNEFFTYIATTREFVRAGIPCEAPNDPWGTSLQGSYNHAVKYGLRFLDERYPADPVAGGEVLAKVIGLAWPIEASQPEAGQQTAAK